MDLIEELEQFRENARKEMRQLYEKIKRNPLTCLICIIVIVTAVVLLIALPYWRVAQFGISDPTDLAEMENNYRATLAQILGGAAVGIGIYFAWGNLTTTKEGQITERFTRAVEQLGDPAIEIRLGGIYALERIANESDKDYWPIIEILTAYVREKSPVKTEILEVNTKVSTDIQAILTVIRRRKYFFDFCESNHLDLQRTYLQGANLNGANLRRANLNKANLNSALLEEVNLQDTTLLGAKLLGTNLNKANIKWSVLGTEQTRIYLPLFSKGAETEEINIDAANLKGASLKEANLFESFLEGVNFEQAILEGANLEGTRLHGANLLEVNLKKANLERADLNKANLKNADFEGANLKEAKNLTIDQFSMVRTLYEAKLDEELEQPLREKYPHLFNEPKIDLTLFEKLNNNP